MVRNPGTAVTVKNAQTAYLAAKASQDEANELSTAAWGEFSEDVIEGWSDEEFATVSETIEGMCGTIPAMEAERAAARALVAAVLAHVVKAPQTRIAARAEAAMFAVLRERWERLASSRAKMIELCLKLAV